MLTMIFLWSCMILMAYLQILPLLRQGERGELFAFCGLWLIGGVYITLVLSTIEIINPFEIVRLLLTSLYDALGLDWRLQ